MSLLVAEGPLRLSYKALLCGRKATRRALTRCVLLCCTQWVDEDDEGDEKKEDFDVSNLQNMQNVCPPPFFHFFGNIHTTSAAYSSISLHRVELDRVPIYVGNALGCEAVLCTL